MLSRIGPWLEHLQPSETVVLGGMALLAGLSAAAGVWLFKWLIDTTEILFFEVLAEWIAPLGGWSIAVLPVLAGLIVGLLMHFFVGRERHHGVAGIIESVALAGGRLRFWRIPVKTLAAAISIGGGASVGPEDPSVQIGANLGSMFGQWLRLSDERMRALVAAGAAAGIAAAFNAPIAGVFFALEVILGEISGQALGVVVLASVSSAVFTQAVSGAQPAFIVPAYAFNSAWELPLYLGLGLLAGIVAAVYVRALYWMQDFFHRWNLPRWLKPALAGLAVGVTGIFFPQVFGVGYTFIENVLAGEGLVFWVLGVLLLLKLVLTPVSIGGGFPGGVFAPSLFLGAALGGAYGLVSSSLLPALDLAPQAYAMVGMAAVLAGAVHSPLTAIMLLYEMTSNYRIILPLMFAVTISLLLSQRLQRDSVYILSLLRKGIRLQRGRDVEILDTISVEQVIQREFTPLKESDTLTRAADLMLHLHRHGMPVVDTQGQLAGILTLRDIEIAQAEENPPLTVGEACTRNPVVAYPDETVGAALRRMGIRDVGRLPVVERDNPCHIIGMLRRNDLLRAYDMALTRRASLRHRARQVRLGAASEVNVEELMIEPGAACDGRSVGEIAWPRDCVLATVQRGRRLLIPRGSTILKAGDVLSVVVEGEALDALKAICHRQADDL